MKEENPIEYMYLLLAEEYYGYPREYKISDLERLAGDIYKKTINNHVKKLKEYLNYSSDINPSLYKIPMTKIDKLPLHSYIFLLRLFLFLYGPQDLEQISKRNINKLLVPAPIYPLYMGIIYAYTKEVQNWKLFRDTAIDVSIVLLTCIQNDCLCPSSFKELDRSIMKSLYKHILLFYFPDELFTVLQTMEQKLSVSSCTNSNFVDNYNLKLLYEPLAKSYLYTSASRKSFYGDITYALINCNSEEVINHFKDKSHIFIQEQTAYYQYKEKYTPYTLNMFLLELKKLEN